jgi:uncharacterized repeat protein (TIGR04138 family)
MNAKISITADVPCVRCGYNLRTLDTGGKCPECATEVIRSAGALFRGQCKIRPKVLGELQEAYLSAVAVGHPYSVEAFKLVLRAFHEATRSLAFLRNSPLPEEFHVDAKYLCRSILRMAQRHFPAPGEAISALHEVGIHRSEDVGNIMFAMVRAVMVIPSPDDKPEDFAGIFVTDTALSPGATRRDQG